MTRCRYKSVQDRSPPPPGSRIQQLVDAALPAAAAAAAAAAAEEEAKRVLDEMLGGSDSGAYSQPLPQQLEVDAPALLQHLPK